MSLTTLTGITALGLSAHTTAGYSSTTQSRERVDLTDTFARLAHASSRTDAVSQLQALPQLHQAPAQTPARKNDGIRSFDRKDTLLNGDLKPECTT